MAKYEPLSRHLRTATPLLHDVPGDQSSRRRATPSASVHRAWWANSRTHVEANAWLELGRRVEDVDLGRQVVRFS